MVCIYCGSKTRVSNSRAKQNRLTIWRRRVCLRCQAIFTTRETIDYRLSLRVRHQNGLLEPFLTATITKDLQQALDHRPHTAAADSIALTETVLEHLLERKPLTPIISTTVIGQTCLQIVDRFDEVAAIKYRSYRPSLFSQGTDPS